MTKIAEQLAEYRARKRVDDPARQNDRTDTGHTSTTTLRTPVRSVTHQWIDSLFQYAETTRFVRTINNKDIISNVTFLKILLWLLLFGLFVHLQFGMIFFIFSIFYVMYASMTNGRVRQAGEPSAYSVFNPDFERIDGTFTSEQFERELLHGSGSIR